MRRSPGRRARPGAFTAVAALSVTLLAGCSGDGGSQLPEFDGGGRSSAGPSTAAASSGASSASPAASVVSGDDVTVVLAAGSSADAEKPLPSLQGYISDLAAAMAEPDHPPQSRWATPSGQAIIDARAAAMRKAKVSLAGPVTVTAKVRVAGRQASVDGCLDQSAVKAHDRRGREVVIEQPQRVRIRALLVGRGTSWRIETFSVPRSGTC